MGNHNKGIELFVYILMACAVEYAIQIDGELMKKHFKIYDKYIKHKHNIYDIVIFEQPQTDVETTNQTFYKIKFQILHYEKIAGIMLRLHSILTLTCSLTSSTSTQEFNRTFDVFIFSKRLLQNIIDTKRCFHTIYKPLILESEDGMPYIPLPSTLEEANAILQDSYTFKTKHTKNDTILNTVYLLYLYKHFNKDLRTKSKETLKRFTDLATKFIEKHNFIYQYNEHYNLQTTNIKLYDYECLLIAIYFKFNCKKELLLNDVKVTHRFDLKLKAKYFTANNIMGTTKTVFSKHSKIVEKKVKVKEKDKEYGCGSNPVYLKRNSDKYYKRKKRMSKTINFLAFVVATMVFLLCLILVVHIIRNKRIKRSRRKRIRKQKEVIFVDI